MKPAMTPVSNPDRHSNANVSDRLHPFVYFALIGIAALFAVAVWGFASGRYVDYLLVIVSGFAVIAVAVPFILWRASQGTLEGSEPAGREPPFREWARGQFGIWQDNIQGSNAAVEILLPLSAAALGMIAFGIVLHLAVPGA